VRLAGISHAYGERPTLADVELACERGEVVALLGPNGAGKTTTIRLLMGLCSITAGEASILGQPVPTRAARQRLGFLPEQPYFYDYLTAEELLGYFAGIFGLSGAERTRRVSTLLDDVGLGAERRLQLRKFSKGMLQRVGIAQALLNEPDLVIFDEPMSGLDPLGRRDVRALILRLRDRGCTVFFSSHVLSDAEALCSRVAILAKGRLVTSGRLTDMLAFQIRGWEIVASGVTPDLAGRLSPRASRTTKVGDDRYVFDLPVDPAPDRVVADLSAAGATLLSVNPIRDTLEDYFVQQVTAPEVASRDRGLGPAGGPR